MLKKAHKLSKPDRAGKNYRPKEEISHTFFFKGYYIIISPDFKNIKIAEVKQSLSPLHNSTLDDALLQAMTEIYKLRDEDYENALQAIAKEEKEKEIRELLLPFINAIVKEAMNE